LSCPWAQITCNPLRVLRFSRWQANFGLTKRKSCRFFYVVVSSPCRTA
jgi:hypothetical protein